MSQDSITQFLKKHKGKFSAKQISNYLGIGVGSVTTSLRRMRHCKELKFGKEEGWRKPYKYWYV